MNQRLTPKQAKFIANIVNGMSGTRAVIDAYGITNANVAAVISSQNLRKLKIKQAFLPYLDKNDICLDDALRPIGLGLKAKININGQEIDDIDMQLRASDRALKLILLSLQD